MRTRFSLVISSAMTALVIAACYAVPDDCHSHNACAEADASVVGDTGVVTDTGPDGSPNPCCSDGSTTCDPSLAPSQNGCVVDEKYGVFVAPNGNDASGDGSRARPFASLTKAAVVAKSTSKSRVFQCAGTYLTPETIGASADEVHAYGGLDCATWAYTGAKTIIAPRAQGPALIVNLLSIGVAFEDFEFDSNDATMPGASSIAVQVSSSKGVVFRRAAFHAGRGADGASAQRKPPAANATSGNVVGTGGVLGGPQCVNTCSNGKSVGGKGGDSGGGNAEAGMPDRGGSYPNNGGKGTDSTACQSGGAGGQGVAGPPATDGAGAKKVGVLLGSNWIPSTGAAGADGSVGQGGGGGGARTGAGGGGGCGGCGGSAGAVGGGGGASIALLSVNSLLFLQQCSLATSGGGDGGAGAAGQLGQPGGGGASGGALSPFNGCAGGDGASGGNGGSGGGGAGGLSVGALYQGTAPQFDAATTAAVTIGAAGKKGIGGVPGANDGVVGVAGSLLDAAQL